MSVRVRWRGLELPVQVEVDQESYSDRYGEFHAEPFERGFGHTVGNSLRRILLSSLEGGAVVAASIDGVKQEFTTLEGVYEDVSEIILNLKGLVLKLHSDSDVTVKLCRSGKGEVTGADMEQNADVEVVNPDHVIARLTEDVDFSCELILRKGRGYQMAEDHDDLPPQIGLIPVDALYSPVQRVAYKVLETRVGRRTDYDKLLLQIWTDGSVEPEMALVEAAKILRKHLNPFVDYYETGRYIPQERPQPLAPVEQLEKPQVAQATISMPIEAMNLSTRLLKALHAANLTTVGDILEKSEDELKKIRNLGDASFKEVSEKLEELGLEVGLLAEE